MNLTALLALAALAELIFHRVLSAAFLSAQPSNFSERCIVDFGAFVSNLSGVLALALAIVALIRALGSDRIFPRSMRITVTTIGLFFAGLAGMGVLWILATPSYHIHLRISHGFLVFFLTLGLWRGAHPLRAKIGISLFAVPMILEAVAVFCHRMGWTRIEPAQIVRVAHAISWAAMCATPALLAPRPRNAIHLSVTLGSAIVLGSGLGVITALRFDLVQAIAFYGLRIDLTGLASSAEQLYTAALIAAFASLGAAIVSCLARRGPYRLTGWGLLLLAVAGQELSSAKPALFTLCGLLAMSIASARHGHPTPTSPTETAQTPPLPSEGSGLPTSIEKA